MNTTEVHAAAPFQLTRVVDTIVLAFSADPFYRWIFPDPRSYLRQFPSVVREFGAGAVENGTAYVAGDFCGAAFWLPPDVRPEEHVLRGLFRGAVSGPLLNDSLEVFERMSRSHPTEPSWYLPMIGVAPAYQNCGLGSALMQHALARVDQDRVLAYLESSNQASIPLYERYGFERTGEISAGNSPSIFPMLRRPR